MSLQAQFLLKRFQPDVYVGEYKIPFNCHPVSSCCIHTEWVPSISDPQHCKSLTCMAHSSLPESSLSHPRSFTLAPRAQFEEPLFHFAITPLQCGAHIGKEWTWQKSYQSREKWHCHLPPLDQALALRAWLALALGGWPTVGSQQTHHQPESQRHLLATNPHPPHACFALNLPNASSRLHNYPRSDLILLESDCGSRLSSIFGFLPVQSPTEVDVFFVQIFLSVMSMALVQSLFTSPGLFSGNIIVSVGSLGRAVEGRKSLNASKRPTKRNLRKAGLCRDWHVTNRNILICITARLYQEKVGQQWQY